MGWIRGKVKKLESENLNKIKLPHIGWNSLKNINDTNKLCLNLNHNEFYFLHSYHCVPDDKNLIVSTTEYGQEFCSSIQFENIIGCQFHPEKSHDAGLELFLTFEIALMLRSRLSPCLLIKDGALVKSFNFKKHKYVGDPLNGKNI